MGKGILLIGESGTGKTTSLEKLDPKSTFIINVKNKPLPFKGWKNQYTQFSKDNPEGNYLGVDDANSIIKTMSYVSEKMPHIKTVIIDDFQYMSANEYMNRAKEIGFQKFTDMGKNLYDVANFHTKLREDLSIVYINHPEDTVDAFGDKKTKAKTVGKLVDNVVTLEGLFTMVLYTKVRKGKEGMDYLFMTQNDGSNTCKSPRGMFATAEIPNDLNYVVEKMNEYYN